MADLWDQEYEQRQLNVDRDRHEREIEKTPTPELVKRYGIGIIPEWCREAYIKKNCVKCHYCEEIVLNDQASKIYNPEPDLSKRIIALCDKCAEKMNISYEREKK